MTDRLSPAVEELERQLIEQQEEVASTKTLINSLLKRMGQEPRYVDVTVGRSGSLRDDEYYGKTVTGAVQLVLKRTGKAINVFEITKQLEQGGFDFSSLGWKIDTYNRNVAISLSKNPHMFHKLPNNSWGLPEWYPGVASKKAKPEKDSALVAEPTDVSPENETAPTVDSEGDS